jgi:prevent-host-death family protein
MEPVSVFDAKNKLSALLDQVERGEEVVITRRGKPIARIVPAADPAGRARAVVREMQDLRASIAARGARFSWEELKAARDEGRR